MIMNLATFFHCILLSAASITMQKYKRRQAPVSGTVIDQIIERVSFISTNYSVQKN